ncbi:peptide chain release factor 1 [Mesoplasma corruscae]|uniref:Peptide chain release factor 1 n=1 Tax=Mesoplasma corruscae TaxID=216874 RepID=A0A2S5RHE3_9MOLU|nr:peptide chain release factor 1 [Mesoplasma corruscae]PPE06707.1 peptide chain release factor 1 [Mesoplasma corruscae]
MNPKTLEALEAMQKRVHQIDESLQSSEVISDVKKFTPLNKERASLIEVVDEYIKYNEVIKNIEEAKQIISEEKDPEMLELAKMELSENEKIERKIVAIIEEMLLPKNPNDDKNVIIEIRGAAGGDEANIFAGDLMRMYRIYSEKQNWKINILESSSSEAGGFSQISFMVKGEKVYSKLKFESGAHRVQRIPKTDTKGRIQTSTATVAVLPEIDEVEIEIKNSDLRIDTYRSSGAGGQSVNTTDSAVRVTHIPTGIVAASQDERSQYANKDLAMAMLRARVYEAELEKQQAQADATRKSAVGTGARSEKIRTYNYPQNRVTDHRIGLTLNKLDQVMEGNIEEFIIALVNEEQRAIVEEQLKQNDN